jgi:hypothetical protein
MFISRIGLLVGGGQHGRLGGKLLIGIVTDYNSFKKNKAQRTDFNNMGSDMASMLDRQMDRKNQLLGNSLVLPSI